MTIEEKLLLLKKELLVQYKEDYIFNHQWDDDFDEKLSIHYAEKCLEIFLKLEGPDRLFNSKEICDSIPLGNYLDMIKNLKEEACLLIAISNHAIQGVIIFFGSNNMITYDDYEKNGIFNILKIWNEKNYKVLNYHNHPNSIAARPCNTDILNLNLNSSPNPNVRKMLEMYDLLNFEYYDWGVVTEFDFYSERQENKSEELKNELDLVQAQMLKLDN